MRDVVERARESEKAVLEFSSEKGRKEAKAEFESTNEKSLENAKAELASAIEKERNETLLTTAKKLKMIQMSVEQIKEITGLSIDQIKSL